MTKKKLKHRRAFKKALAGDLDAGDFVVTRPEVLRWFNLFNQSIFDNKVPEPKFSIRRLRYMGWAEADPYKITLRNRYQSERKMIQTIAHEMVHLLEYVEKGTMCHGLFFKQWRQHFKQYDIRL